MSVGWQDATSTWLTVAQNRTRSVPWLGAARMRVKAGFDEAAHPRDEMGKFSEGGGEGRGAGGETAGVGGEREYHEMPNLDTAKQFAAANYAGWQKSLTLEETSALRTYAAAKGDYHALNDQLRGQADTEEGQQLVDKLTSTMDVAIDRATIRADVVLWRGANQTGEFADPEALIGKVIQDNGYVSTGLTEDRGGQWAATAERHGEVPLLIEVRAPKGTKGAYLEDIQTTESGKSGEFEVLLPRGSRFKVVSYRASRKKGFLIPDRERFPLLVVEVVK